MRRRRRIGLFSNTLSYTYQNDIVLGAHDELAARDADLFCFSGGELTASEQTAQQRSTLYDLVGPGDLDGLIITTSTLAHQVSEAVVKEFCRRFHPMPLCSIGYRIEGVPSLHVENSVGVRELTRHLVAVHGRRRVAFLSGPAQNMESQSRLGGYRAGLADEGIEPDPELLIAGDYTREAGMEAVRQLFDRGGRGGRDGAGCDAIVAANDWMALGLLEALDERGIRVPDQVAVVGFDDIDEARFTTPPLTTIRQPIREIGTEAARLVLAQADGQPVAPTLTLPTRPRFRQSCGCFHDARHTATAPGGESARVGTSALVGDRDLLAQAVAEAAPDVDEALAGGWPARLVAAFCDDISQRTDRSFVARLDELLRQTAALGNIQAWHSVVTILRARCISYLETSPADWRRAEVIFERAHLIVSDIAERAQGKRRLDQEGLIRLLQQTSTHLRTAFDMPSIASALADSLPRLGIPSGYVALHRTERVSPDSDAQLIMSYDSDRESPVAAVDRIFREGDLVPSDLLPDRRHTIVVEPLFFGGDVLGFSAFELGPREGTVYETLREQISATVKGARLFATVVEEVTKREQAERARLEGEMNIARRIQTGILPKHSQVAGLEIAAVMLPATEVGGDYFDVLPFEGGCWLGIGDVAGHGLPTGLVMLMIQSIVAATTHCRTDGRPGQIWEIVNAVLYDNVRQRLEQVEYATLSLIRYESSGQLVFAGAHEDLVIYRKATGRCEIIPVQGAWAGMMPRLNKVVPEGSTSLSPGDLVVLYTDGVTEAMDAGKMQFGMERLCHEIEQVADRSVEEIRDHLVSAVHEWSAAQFDDLTLVVVRQGGGRPRINTRVWD